MNKIILLYQQLTGKIPSNFPAEMSAMLWDMDKHNPQKRQKNSYDDWFLNHLEEFCQYDEALELINHWKYLTYTYLHNLKQADKNTLLQQKLISVYYNEMLNTHLVRYKRLLRCYLELWDLSSEIKEMMYTDVKYYEVLRMYRIFRYTPEQPANKK